MAGKRRAPRDGGQSYFWLWILAAIGLGLVFAAVLQGIR